jgi:SAM-dependent methyltransferase
MALDALEQAPRFNQWMYESIRPHLGRQVAELGSGRGNLSKYLRGHGSLLVTDFRTDYLDELRDRWGDLSRIQLARLDLCAPQDYEVLRQYRPDTVVCLNVLEHIEDDRAVLAQLHRVVPVGARLVFLVPFNPALTSEFDRRIGHFRRYQRGELESKMTDAGFVVVRQFYFNKVGVLAWWVGNKLSGQRTITPWQLRLYNLLTPVFKWVDRVLPTTGLSTVVVAKKAEPATAGAVHAPLPVSA